MRIVLYAVYEKENYCYCNEGIKIIHINGKYILLLLQSALQPLWVLACSTIVEYSQQEGFYRVPLPAALQTSD